MSKNCIVSFANEKGRYIQNLARLSESLRDNFDGDFLGFINESSLGCESHGENPYSFKIYAIQKAIDAGYENILYLDTSVFAIKNVNPIFEEIQTNGFIFQEAGHYLGVWANDLTLNHFGISRDEAMNMLMIGNAGFLGLNIKSEIGLTFFKMWKESMEAGCFKGAWTNETKSESQDERCKGARHDMSASSAIANKLGIIDKCKKGDEVLQYAGLFQETANDTIIFKAQG